MSSIVPSGWFSRAWIVAVTAYAVVRALLAWPTLGQYGVNPAIFLIIDIATAPPYAMGQVGIVSGFRSKQWGQVQFWAVVVLVTFLAPYVYIVVAGREELPLIAYIVLAILVVVFGTASVLRMRSQVRQPDEVEPIAQP
ncbi:MAG: hypothetical protein ACR2P0_10755 [Acidimicrobiales bacterium]